MAHLFTGNHDLLIPNIEDLCRFFLKPTLDNEGLEVIDGYIPRVYRLEW